MVELSNEDGLAHPHILRVFDIPHLMTHLWRNQLSKDMYVLFTLNVGPSFWPQYMHEHLIVLIVLPLARVTNYRGPWVLQGRPSALEVYNQMKTILKHPELYGCRQFHDL